jgi:hypothetical protein
MKGKKLITAMLMIGLFGSIPASVFAKDHGRHHVSSDRRHEFKHHERVQVGHQDYYYGSGRFYRPGRTGLMEVQAPLGAIVATLPFGAATVKIGLNSYFFANGAYFSKAPRGYRVVRQPALPSFRHRDQHRAGRVLVQPGRLNLRSGPGRQFAVRAQLRGGEPLLVRGQSAGWY